MKTQRLRGTWGSQISTYEGDKVAALGTGRFNPHPPMKYSWNSFLLGTESTTGPYCVRNNPIGNWTRDFTVCKKGCWWPTSWCRRTESIVSLERGLCSCAELQVFSCYKGWKKHVRRREQFQQHGDANCHQVFFFSCKPRSRRKFTPFWQEH